MAKDDVTISVGLDTTGVKNSISSLRTDILAVGATLTAAFAGFQVLNGIKAITEAASVQEDAINQLNTSLKLAGDFSLEASQDFQDFAASLQSVTTVGDETVLQLAALARNFTTTNEQAQELTKAALDLSAATGISTDSAIRNLGKTLGGLSGELGEVVPALKELTEEQLRAGEGIEFIAERFEGAAAALRNTFSGAVQVARNDFGDFLEELGFAITQNPAVITAINALADGFKRIGTFVADNQKEIQEFIKEGITALIRGLSVLTEAFVDNFDSINKTIRAFGKLSLLTFQSVKQGLSGIALVFIELARSFEFYREILARAVGDTDGAVLSIQQNRETLAALSKDLQSEITDTAKDSEKAFEDLIKIFNSPELKPENNALLATLKQIAEELDNVAEKAEGVNITGEVVRPEDTATTNAAGAGVGSFIIGLGDEFAEQVITATEFVVDSLSSFVSNLGDAALGVGVLFKDILVAGAEGFSDKAAAEQQKIAKQSAEAFVAQSAGLITDAFLPGAGQFVTALLELAKDPESFQAFIEGFANALPDVIRTLAESIPVIIDALVEALPAIVDAFIEAIPLIIEAIIDALPDIIAVIIEQTPRIAAAFVKALVENADDFVIAVVQGIAKGISEVFENLAEDLRGIFDIGGGGGQGFVEKGLGFDIPGVGFADGGIVPPGFPNDSFPARLSSGEVVLNEEQQREMFGPQTITVNLVLNEETLASTILELNRDNRRLA